MKRISIPIDMAILLVAFFIFSSFGFGLQYGWGLAWKKAYAVQREYHEARSERIRNDKANGWRWVQTATKEVKEETDP